MVDGHKRALSLARGETPMTVILVLLTVVIFTVIDFVLSRKRVGQAATAAEAVTAIDWDPNYVEGFLVPERFQYHPGHSWVLSERKRLARVGMDEFAAALMGRIERIELPKPGTWLRQGQKVIQLLPRRGEDRSALSDRGRSDRGEPRGGRRSVAAAQGPLRGGAG